MPSGLIKPTGFPGITTPNPLGIIFYAFDTGTGVYSVPQDCAPGHSFDPPRTILNGPPSIFGAGGSAPFDPNPALITTGSTAFGTAILWPGAFKQPGISCFVGGGSFDAPLSSGPGGSPMRDAVNLQAATTGVAYTMFATFMMTSNPPGSSAPLICGRGFNLDNNWYTHAFTVTPSTSQLNFAWSSSVSGVTQSLSQTGTFTLNALHTAIVVCTNTAPGVSSITLYIDGTSVGTAAGAQLADVTAGAAGNEDQFQIGAQFHCYGPGQSDSGFIGSVYQCGLATTAWTTGQINSFVANPYQYLGSTTALL